MQSQSLNIDMYFDFIRKAAPAFSTGHMPPSRSNTHADQHIFCPAAHQSVMHRHAECASSALEEMTCV